MYIAAICIRVAATRIRLAATYIPTLVSLVKTSSNVNQQKRKIMTLQVLNTKEAAQYLNMSTAFLERDRWAGARIPFVKVGSRAVRYLLTDLNSYLESQVRKSTSDQGCK